MGTARGVRVAAALVGLLACSGCMEISYPTASALRANLTAAPSVDDVTSARAYIYTARDSFMKTRKDLRNEEGMFNAGVAGGSITALLAGALHWSAKAVIKATVLSGASYAGTQTLQPRAQLEVVDASLAALDCVSARAEAAYPAASSRALVLQPVVEARERLVRDAEDPDLPDPSSVEAAKAAVAVADTFVNAHQSQVYQQVRLGVDAVVTAANTQMREATADPTAVQRAFAGLTVPAATAPPAGAEAPQANRPPDPKKVNEDLKANGMKSAQDIAFRTLAADIDALNAAMEAANGRLALLPASAAALDLQGCLPGAIVLVVKPAGPVTLAPLQGYELAVTGGQHAWGWSGPVPPEIAVTARSASLYHLAASKDLKAGETYTLAFTPYVDGPPKMVTVTTAAAKPGNDGP